MAAIQTLLNPLPEVDRSLQLPSPCSTVYAREFSADPPSRKKLKLSKDAAVFTRGTLRGECRYPPCEHQDDVLAAHYQQYEIHPMGHIAEFPRHIPYNSEKKSFLEKTGRESFEGRPLQTLSSCHMLIHNSVPVQLQGSWRREDILHDVGLQHWTCSDNSLVQVQRILKGVISMPSTSLPRETDIADYSCQDAQPKPWSSGHMSQYHGRSTGCTRSSLSPYG